ncbi:LANO_0F07008g1_1 [Lachancea nothofagi CBS 11611]|uniref:LANO_0F07008g1_1 n=1 Tax=Lachancea nothofagi CBS 11611 TaxID=1266666 RepID=A0A1G4K8T1_9SACH|nr:LANO_0F07008g1_1 [Lachancea nothofagi CBS 11611]
MANLLLQDPFSVLKEYPERLTQTLETPLHTCCVQFSQGGDYLALGCSNGAVIIYDMDTAKPISMLGNKGGGHVRSIQSIAWSKDGRYILTSSRDWYVKMWDLKKPGEPARQVKFDSPVWTCQWQSNGTLGCVATVYEENHAFSIDLESDVPTVSQICDIGQNEGQGADGKSVDYGYTLVACMHPKHKDLLLTGTSKGWIKIYRLSQQAKELIHTFRFAYSNAKHMIISQSGDRIAINSADRTIRQYMLTMNDEATEFNFTLEYRYQDVINRLQWNGIFFSSNSAEYLVASTHGSSAHDLYLWETSTGTLVRVLEGTEEELLDIDWDFYNMCIASNGLETGNVYIWSLVIPPKWSALAPDFEEVEENIEYREKEDEFDQVGQLEQQQELDQAEEVKIDLRTRESFDVRGNEISFDRFVIPIDYESILMLKYWDREN